MTESDEPLVLPDPLEPPAPAPGPASPPGPHSAFDGPALLSIGIVLGLIVGAIGTLGTIGFLLDGDGNSRLRAGVLASVELATGVLLITLVARRAAHRLVAGFAIGVAVALLLSSLCWGVVGLSR